jgi:hypothetical protein
MTEEKKPFIVSDRRHFTPEGEARATEAERPEAEERPGPPAAATPPTPAAVAPPPEPMLADDPEAAGEPGPPADFVSLLLSLGAQAAYLLGGGPPGEPAGEADPEGARAYISLLEVLKDKSEGRRTPEEDQVLDGLLYQLRMAYVARTRMTGA